MKKFTLIELLVVVAIIGILVSILLPSLTKARQEALSAACKSNLKQIGVGVYLYTGDNRGYMPTSNVGNTAQFSPGMINYLSIYLSIELHETDMYQTDVRGTVFDEPVLNGPVNGGIDHSVASGYGWNWRYMGYKQSAGGAVYRPQLLDGVHEPAMRMLAGDTSDTKNLWGHLYFRYQNVGNRHRNNINALYADGHVKLTNRVEISSNSNEKWWYDDSSH